MLNLVYFFIAEKIIIAILLFLLWLTIYQRDAEYFLYKCCIISVDNYNLNIVSNFKYTVQ